MAAKEIKAVLFDLGETILNFGKLSNTALFTEAGKIAYDYLKEIGQPVPGFNRYLWKNLLGIRWEVFKSSITGNDFDSLAALKKYGDRKKFDLTDQQWNHINWCWYKPLRDIALIEPNLHQTLGQIQDMGIKLGVISNTFINGSALDRHLEEEGLIEFFPMRIYSYQLNFRKPDKRIFLAAAERMSIPPENTLYIGDRIDNDVIGAKKANMRPILKSAYTNIGKKTPPGVTKIDHISQLPAIINETNR